MRLPCADELLETLLAVGMGEYNSRVSPQTGELTQILYGDEATRWRDGALRVLGHGGVWMVWLGLGLGTIRSTYLSPYSVGSPGSALTVFVRSQPDGSQGFAEAFLDTRLLLFPTEREKPVVGRVLGVLRRHSTDKKKIAAQQCSRLGSKLSTRWISNPHRFCPKKEMDNLESGFKPGALASARVAIRKANETGQNRAIAKEGVKLQDCWAV